MGEGKGVARAHKTKQAGGGAEGGGGVYIQPSGWGGERGGERKHRTKYTQEGGGGREIARINTIYMYKQRLFSIWFHCFLIIII